MLVVTAVLTRHCEYTLNASTAMQYDSVYHSPVEELIRRCSELAEYWLVVVRRELIRRTVGQYLIGRSTGDHGLQEEMVRRRSYWNGRVEEGLVVQSVTMVKLLYLSHFDLLTGLATISSWSLW